MSKRIISSLVIASLMLIANAAVAERHDLPGRTPPVENPCPDGWQLKGSVKKNSLGSPIFVCVPKEPALKCGPGTAPKIRPCEVGCQPKK